MFKTDSSIRRFLKLQESRKIRIVVELEILKDADEQDIMSECDYSFKHADIVETEILGEAD
jgi:hypothetical protein